QEEDGIRDFHVTGVQTCALPIFPTRSRRKPESDRSGRRAQGRRSPAPSTADLAGPPFLPVREASTTVSRQNLPCFPAGRSAGRRSEERRVGKGRPYRWVSSDT